MTKNIFVLAAVVYWVCFALRLVLWNVKKQKLEQAASVLEKVALLVFTAALVFYIGKLQIVNGEVHSLHYDRPVSFLLFAWAISAANLTSEIVYGNTFTAIFSNFWTGLSLTISSASAALLQRVFTSDLEWLSFHRLCFLLGYAFCLLALPLTFDYLRGTYRWGHANDAEKTTLERTLWKCDRMIYRMILWALPLLTAGIVTEALVLLELNRFPSPEEIFLQKQETLLALTAWFLCGIYLHTRLFFGWTKLKSVSLYLTGVALLFAGHFSQIYLSRRI